MLFAHTASGWRRFLLAAAVLQLIACSDASQAETPGAGGGGADGGGGAGGGGGASGGGVGGSGVPRDAGEEGAVADRAAGLVEVTEGRWSGASQVSSTVVANFYAAEVPETHETTLQAGACRVLEFKQGFCMPACTYPDICGRNNVCRPYFPVLVSAGTLTFSGLSRAVTMQPDPLNNRYFFSELVDLFADDATVGVSAQGAAIPAFQTSAKGAPAFTSFPLTNNGTKDVLAIPRSGDFTLTWQPALGADRARVRLTLVTNNQAHGAPISNMLECDAPDTGSLTVARAVLDAFPPWKTPDACVLVDCPLSDIVRYTTGTAKLPDGRAVELRVGAQLQFPISKE